MSAHHYSLVNYATVRIVPALTSNTYRNTIRNTPRTIERVANQGRLTPLRLCLCLLVVLLVLVGCGPKDGEGESDMQAEVVRIAQEFQQSGDLGSARAELEKLDVANPTQFLIFLAEERTDSAAGTPETAALVQFALALGLQSGELMAYALQNGLIAPPAAPTPATAAQPVVQAAPPTAANQPAPTAAAVAELPAAQVITATSAPAAGATAQGTNAPSEESAALPTPTVAATTAAPVALPTATPVSKPQVQASNGLNVRSGPGVDYPVVGALNGGEQADIVAKNPEGDWWEINVPSGGTGWVYGQLVQATGDTGTIAVATDIPAAPPTPTPAPVAEVPTAQPEQPTAQPEQPADQPTAAPPPATSGNDFIAIERRLWNVQETGGELNGDSVKCGLKRELHVIVLDANGNRINGVAVQAIYGAQEIYVTGAQGKGDGQSEFVLGAGQGVKVIRDTDGREVTSDVVDGLSTHSPDISHTDLIAAGYCHDDASCDKFNASAGCWGHHSWTVTFKRRY